MVPRHFRPTGSLDDTAADASGIYTVTQSSSGTFTRGESGNRVTGAYTKTENASDTYTMQLTGVGAKNFTLHQTGVNAYTDSETGNTITGGYTRTKTGADTYTLQEDGTKPGGAYSETVTGSDNYTLIDNGNLGTGTYIRTIDGTGSYDRTVTGPGTTLPSGSGTIGYHWDQTADPHSGTFSLTRTGTDRYALLEDFHDVSNTQNGQTPGHMNFYPFGQTFVDPFSWQAAVAGGLTGAGVGGLVGAGVGFWGFGIGAIPGAIGGAVVGAIIGAVAGGFGAGTLAPDASGWEQAAIGALIGIPAGIVGGIIGAAGAAVVGVQLGCTWAAGFYTSNAMAFWTAATGAGAGSLEWARRNGAQAVHSGQQYYRGWQRVCDPVCNHAALR